MADTKYSPTSILFHSKGLAAHYALDRLPDGMFLNLDQCYERDEESISSRFGNILITRDAVGAGTNNYLLPAAPVILSRLKSLSGNTYRYAALSNGALYRRATDIQGQYTSILTGLSGKPFNSLVTTCYQSANPFLFIFDPTTPVKDSGIGTPSRIGIFAPTIPTTTIPYAPIYQLLLDYDAVATLSPGVVLGSPTTTTVPGAGGVSRLGGDHTTYRSGPTIPPSYVRGYSGLGRGLLYYPQFYPPLSAYYIDWVQDAGLYQLNDTFSILQQDYIVPASVPNVYITTLTRAGGTVSGVSASPHGLAIGQQFTVVGASDASFDGLFTVLTVPTTTTWTYAQSGTSTSATGGTIVPPANSITWYMSATDLSAYPNSSDFALSLTVLDANTISSLQVQFDIGGSGFVNYYTAPLNLEPQVSLYHIQKASFAAAGAVPVNGWADITACRLLITTPTTLGANVLFNAIWIEGLNALPSSFGGVGYDYRYIYKNFNTGTPSNPSPTQLFPTTPDNPSASSTLIVFDQSINVSGRYSSDPQVTHVQIYRRGGLYGKDWYYLDQIPNITGSGTWSYEDSIPDSSLQQSTALTASGGLAMDVPVTSTLQNPISTTLSASIVPPTPVVSPTPVTVTVALSSAVFVRNQIVNIGTPNNFEQVTVDFGGTGTFSAQVQLEHTIGEPVQVYSLPGVSCNLAALAYNQLWRAGDPNNPHYLYYSPVSYPENNPPQNYIPVGTPSDPITLLVNYGGNLFVSTLSTWYQVFPGINGGIPYAQSTGSTRGCVASFGWTFVEGSIAYAAADGIRLFQGTEGAYYSLLIEWLWQDNPLTPVTLIDTTKLSSMLAAYRDNQIIFVYTGTDGNPHRLLYSTVNKRWRNDDIPATAIYLETDTDTLVYSKPMTIGGVSGWGVVYDAYNQDYDDGGWVAGALTKLPIPITIQTPYRDQNAPNNQKQYNTLTIDANPNGQTLGVQLLFDDNNGVVAPVTPNPPTFTGPVRNKFEFQINSGAGQQAYRMSVVVSGNTTSAPQIYQMDYHTALLAECRTSFDSYWLQFGSELQKLIKQVYVDYTTDTSNTISCACYADGSATPYYTFTLPVNLTRSQVPMRVRLGNTSGVGIQSMRLFRLIMTSPGSFQLWSPLTVDQKSLLPTGATGYKKTELGDTM